MVGKQQIEYCPPLFSGQLITCQKEQCHIWDTDRNQCLAKLYLSGYIKSLLVDQKLANFYDKVSDRIDKEDKEF